MGAEAGLNDVGSSDRAPIDAKDRLVEIFKLDAGYYYDHYGEPHDSYWLVFDTKRVRSVESLRRAKAAFSRWVETDGVRRSDIVSDQCFAELVLYGADRELLGLDEAEIAEVIGIRKSVFHRLAQVEDDGRFFGDREVQKRTLRHALLFQANLDEFGEDYPSPEDLGLDVELIENMQNYLSNLPSQADD
jgi:hypothetical protein